MTPPDAKLFCRRFESHVEALAKRCADSPIVSETFVAEGNLEGGGTSSRRVKISSSGLTAWVKPARIAADNMSCVANEKIASDLAYKLGLPVAPVQIFRDHKVDGFPDIVVASYAASPQPRPWGQVVLSNQHKQDVAPALGAMLAFHAWIDDHDHSWSDANALCEILSAVEARPVFIDYSFSLTRQWKPPTPAPVRNWRMRPGPYSYADTGSMATAVDRIEQFAFNELQSIIARVPRDCLSVDTAAALATGLFERRLQLRQILGLP